MTEEEKKAIEYLRKWVHWETAGERNLEGDIETALNLIDKKLKEIKELKENQTIFKEMKEELKPLVKGEYISKDKIKNILVKFQNEYGEDLLVTGRLFIGKEVVQYGEDMLDEIAKELDIKLLEE